jgi:predicted N-formylglutamate amidohydrolase
MIATFKPFETVEGDFSRGIVLLGDHAMRHLPAGHGSLGLPPEQLGRHIAYDIGIEWLTRALSRHLGAPAVMATFSRLLIDPNRGLVDPTLIRQIYDHTVIAGNYPLADDERQQRIERYHHPYHQAVAAMIAQSSEAAGAPPLVISLHSFTPSLHGVPRPWHVGILTDTDRRAADPLLALLGQERDLTIGDNQPYDGALPGDTMFTHCTSKGIAHALVEIRQDLIATRQSAEQWATRLAPMLDAVNADPDIHVIRHFGSRVGEANGRKET